MPKHGTKTNRPSAFVRAGRAIAAFFTTNRPSRGKAIALVSVLAVFGILFVSLGSVMVSFAYRREIIRDLPDESLGIDTSADAEKSKDITNIALFGLGTRSKTINRGLTDSIMVVSVDRLHNKIKVISVMRDSLVPIEGYRAQNEPRRVPSVDVRSLRRESDGLSKEAREIDALIQATNWSTDI